MQPSEDEQPGSGTAIAIGALLDGVPESIVLGMSLLGGAGVGVPVLAGIFISNLPEGLSSTSGMKRQRARCALRVRRLGRHRAGLRRRRAGRAA